MRSWLRAWLLQLRIIWGLTRALVASLFFAAVGAIGLAATLAWIWVRGHGSKGDPCPGPTGWSPGEERACVWCHPELLREGDDG